MEAIRGGGDDGDIGSKITQAQSLCFRRLSPKLFFLEAATTKKGEEQKARSSCYRLQATGYSTRAASKCKRHQGEIFGVDAKVKWMRKFSINIHF
ncbi:hypothetical protein NC652_014394 [Populus alba x Populus x berolinensis]|nr:hypothetical protein NC652_014394 [Populus alba x Populus x berolinensis]